MTKYRFISILGLILAAAIFATGCGSQKKSVGANDVAVVGNCVISKEQFRHLFDQAKASYKAQKRELKPGTTEYNAVKKTAMQILTQRCQFDQKANQLGVKVSDSDVGKQLQSIKAQYFGKAGKCDAACEQKYKTQLKRQGLTDEQVREDVRASTVQNKIYTQITKEVTVSDKEIDAYYKKNKQTYVLPASRDVRQILVKKKALAEQLYQQAKGGADFAKLAKKYSEDTSSKATGGKVTISKGRQLPQVDQAAFALKPHELSKPIKTQYGWYIIQALTPVKKQRVTPLKEVRPAIRQQLTQTKKQAEMKKWVDGVQKDFASKTTYQVGYAPPATTNAGTPPQQ